MKIAYFDCFAGASGDMILGAMLDAGLALERLAAELDKLHLSHYRLDVRPVQKMGLYGSQAVVEIDQDHHGHHHRRLADILQILQQSDLEAAIQQKSAAIFQRLAEAEARVHRQPVEAVHFHEVGAMDLGAGTVTCAHGTLPIPAPATAELVKGVPAYSSGVIGELLTPTGAAILTTLASSFGPMPEMIIEQIGYGAGVSEPGIPNLLRLMIGKPTA
jgi:uncharacterized protein (DUF111 family)